MVAPIYTLAFAATFLSAATVLALAIVWVSLRGDAHTPPPLRSGASD